MNHCFAGVPWHSRTYSRVPELVVEELDHIPVGGRRDRASSGLEEPPPSGWRRKQSLTYYLMDSFIFDLSLVAFTMCNQAYAATVFWRAGDMKFAGYVLVFWMTTKTIQYYLWVNAEPAGGSIFSELRRCCARGVNTEAVKRVIVVESVLMAPSMGYLNTYAFLVSDRIPWLAIPSALYALFQSGSKCAQIFVCSSSAVLEGEEVVLRTEKGWQYTGFSTMLTVALTTEFAFLPVFSMVFHPVCTLLVCLISFSFRWCECHDFPQSMYAACVPGGYFSASPLFGQGKTSPSCLASKAWHALHFLLLPLLAWVVDLPTGLSGYVPDFMVTALPTLARPMGHSVVKAQLLRPAKLLATSSVACIRSFCSHVGDLEDLVGRGCSLTIGPEDLYHGIVAVIIFTCVPIVFVCLCLVVCVHDNTFSDPELHERCLRKQEAIIDWCQSREKRLGMASLSDMVRFDLGCAGVIDSYDDPEYVAFLERELASLEREKAMQCEQCDSTGVYGCRSKCNQCNGTGNPKNKVCRIEETSNHQGKVACPDDQYAECPHCGKKFCSYHFFVNKSDAFGSFGGHVCTAAGHDVPSRSKDFFRSLGAFLGHQLGFW